jgi:hypothetical protein
MLCMQQVSSEQQAPGSNREVEEAASAVAKGKCTAMLFHVALCPFGFACYPWNAFAAVLLHS